MPQLLRVLESLASIRLLKLARYYEGAELLQRAIARALSQLLVPMFMLFIMLVCFSALLVELEWSYMIEYCRTEWLEQGVHLVFLNKHHAGPTWTCSAACEDLSIKNFSTPSAPRRPHKSSSATPVPASPPHERIAPASHGFRAFRTYRPRCGSCSAR